MAEIVLCLDTAALDEVSARHHFSRYSGGGDKGNEDINSHYRRRPRAIGVCIFRRKPKPNSKDCSVMCLCRVATNGAISGKT